MEAVSSNKTPTTMEAGLQKPLIVRPQRIRITPRIMRIILSAFATFLLVAIIIILPFRLPEALNWKLTWITA
jgi:hypothetical protein